MSASLAHATIECHSVFSCFCPSFPVHCLEVASRKFATRCPPGVVRTSGSDPRLPTRMTLFTPATLHPQCDEVCVGDFLDDRLPGAPRQGVSETPTSDNALVRAALSTGLTRWWSEPAAADL